jgi:hypothetical protein
MSDRSRRTPFEDLPAPDDPLVAGPLVYRRHFLPPILSVALVVATIVGFAGVGLGYRLGQADRATSPASTDAAQVPQAIATSTPDLQPDSVSDRLQAAYRDIPAGSWAICELADTIVCQQLEPDVSVSPAVHYTSGFTNSDMAKFGQPTVGRGHVVLAAGLGEGSVTASLVAVDAPIDGDWGHALTPIDPGRSGVDYFDLGLLDGGTYGIVVGFIPQPAGDNSAPLLDTFLASFAVTG